MTTTSALNIAVGDTIEVARPHWSEKKGAYLSWQKAIVVKLWAYGEVTVTVQGSERQQFFVREHWRVIDERV